MANEKKVGARIEDIVNKYILKSIKREGLLKSIGTVISFGFVPQVGEKKVVFSHPQKDSMIISSFDDIGASMVIGYSLGIIDAKR